MDIQIFLSIIGVASALATLWHTVVLKPMKEEIAGNSRDIRRIELSHVELNATLNHLALAIEKLTQRLDKE